MAATVWEVALDRPISAAERASLSTEESARAARLRNPLQAARWCVAHVALRSILAERLRCAPADLQFTSGANGKPELTWPSRTVGPPTSFNLSHADGQALVAVADEGPVGVDIERVMPVPEITQIASSHFAPEERAALEAEPRASRLAAFYRIWTRKEAFVKATGVGVGDALQRFAVATDADEARLLRVDEAVACSRTWRLVDLRLELPWVGALALPAEASGEVRRLRWP